VPGSEAERRTGKSQLVYESTSNGKGPYGWNHHWLLVPLFDPGGAVRGLIWTDEPRNRLLPSEDVLQALRIFGNHAMGALAVATQLTETKFLADHDALTRLLNRRALLRELEALCGRHAENAQQLALDFLDLDNFKEINDTRGHAAGDDVLRWAVDVMNEVVRPMDVVGRIGGDEFAIVVPGAGPDDSAVIAGRVQKALADRAPSSVGVACFPTDGADREELQRAADGGLYVGKRGRARPAGIKLTAKELSWATALARAVDERMAVQHEHSWKVAEHCVAIASRLGWSEHDLELLQMAAILHDVGKVSIPDHILRKRYPLTDKEWEAIKLNPVRGAEMVGRIQGLESIVPWVRHTHERPDGAGYPDGLGADAIPEACRILHIADAFDAMVSGRPYRRPMTYDEALEELRRFAGAQFDSKFVELFAEQLEVSEAV
jgi:diguanylate cyclase (GGDEF)-like protein